MIAFNNHTDYATETCTGITEFISDSFDLISGDWDLNRKVTEHLFRLRIRMIFNIYNFGYNLRMMFPKSGFLAGAGRRKKCN